MSGLFGIVDPKTPSQVDPFLQAISQKLSYFSWHASDTWKDADIPVGFGRIGIGIFNRQPQPIVSTDNRYILFMCGEFYRTGTLRKNLEQIGVYPRDQSDPELALATFQAFGSDFATKLEGAFQISVYDRVKRQLIMANDRYGLYPHYYYVKDGRFVFAPEVKGVLCAPYVTKNVNRIAVDEYVRFQHLLGTKTFHEDISLFPYASVGQFDLETGRWTIHRYWDWDRISDQPNISFQDAAIEVSRLFREAVVRLSSDELRPGVFLSGGLDSRAILGLVPHEHSPPVSATFGAEGSRDVYYAGNIARVVGSKHFWFDLPNAQWILDNLDLHFKLTEGFHSWIHMHGITMLPTLRSQIDYNLTGWDGGTIMGHGDAVTPLLCYPVDFPALIGKLYSDFTKVYTWPSLDEGEARQLYAPAYQACGVAFESFKNEFESYRKFQRHYAAEYFYLVNHCFRMSIHMVTMARSHFEVRFPFWDYKLIDFMYGLSPEIREKQILYRTVITREMPKLARIPYDKQEFLPTVDHWPHRLQSISVRLRRRAGIYPDRATLYADYEGYLRGELRSWAEDLLLDERTASRDMWNMDFVRSLLARHFSGQELWTIGKIAPLMTLEMVMREFFD